MAKANEISNNSAPERKLLRILIVEDQKLFKDLLYHSLSSQPSLEVLGAAENGEAAVDMAKRLKPDVVIMDIELGKGINGIEAGHLIKKENPATGIVILSMHSEKEYVSVIPLSESTGWSYLLKNSVYDLSALTRAIEGTAMGFVVMDPAIVSALNPKRKSSLDDLTPREMEVLELIAQGYSNGGIAEKLVLSAKSVERHINSMYQKLHLSMEDNIHPRVKAVIKYLDNSH